MLKNAPFSQALKTCFGHPFFQKKSCHSKTDKDFFMKPTLNSHTNPKFSVKDSRDNLSQFKAIKTLRVYSTYQRKFDPFQEIPVQSNKAVLAPV